MRKQARRSAVEFGVCRPDPDLDKAALPPMILIAPWIEYEYRCAEYEYDGCAQQRLRGRTDHDRSCAVILEPKIRDAERVPCSGNYTAAFFAAPFHVLPFVVSQWPSRYRHPVFITPDELAEWRKIYDAEESDQESWWYVFQDWDAQLNPSPDSFWLRDAPVKIPTDVTPTLIVWGLCWGSLAGGHRAELWGIDRTGNESFLQDVGDVMY